MSRFWRIDGKGLAAPQDIFSAFQPPIFPGYGDTFFSVTAVPPFGALQ
jgi:hypothetical protein